MKSRFLLLVLAAAAFTSCSTAYKSGQTPDDVYYSPDKEGAAYVNVKENQSSSRGYAYDNTDDRYLRMKVRNPYRWNAFDDYDWNMYSGWSNNFYSPYSNNWNSYWNGYYSWNSWYNPYCRNVIVVNPKTNYAAYNKVRNFSLNSYSNTNYANSNRVYSSKGAYRSSQYNNTNSSNNNSNLGTSIRKVFNGSSNNNNSYTPSSNERPTRSYTPSSSSSSSGSSTGGSSGGSSGGGVSRPGRGG